VAARSDMARGTTTTSWPEVFRPSIRFKCLVYWPFAPPTCQRAGRPGRGRTASMAMTGTAGRTSARGFARRQRPSINKNVIKP
jgi:hypothetical protein